MPTVTFRSNFSPVLPSHKAVCPDVGRSANFNNDATSSTEAQSKTGVEIGTPEDKFKINSSNSFCFKGLIFFSNTSFP